MNIGLSEPGVITPFTYSGNMTEVTYSVFIGNMRLTRTSTITRYLRRHTMARGRFISKEITIDKKVNSLSSPWSMLAFTWLLTHADGNGRTHGDPSVVRSIIFPRQSSVTIDDVEGYIREWDEIGLINWYQVGDEYYIEFPNFGKHQIGLRPEKEGKSFIPANPENISHTPEVPGKNPESSGQIPEVPEKKAVEVEEKLREVNGMEEECTTGYAPQFFNTGWHDRIFINATNMTGIPRGDAPKVYEALDAMRSKFTTEAEMVAYLKPYFEGWTKKKTKDGRYFSKSNCAWLYDWALAGDAITVPAPNRVYEVIHAPEHDPDCPLCHGKGKYMSEKSGRNVVCDCVLVREEVVA
jgi:hypothetical protein